jgi:hypothetical protein
LAEVDGGGFIGDEVVLRVGSAGSKEEEE